MHRATRGHQALNKGDLDGHGIGAEIMTRHDLRLYPKLVEKSAEAHAERLHAHQIEFRWLGRARMAEPPARVIFPKACRRYEGDRLESQGVGREIGGRFRQHRISFLEWRAIINRTKPATAPQS